ncbi:glycosyltransferase family 2 protein [Asaccharospora irregularis]|nr:glycosyltransferase family 2 protein [Asaccharospora irregularis]
MENSLETTKKSKGLYISVHAKFYISILIALLWVLISFEVSRNWIEDLSKITSPMIAYIVIAGVAYVPGFMNAFLVSSLILDRQPKVKNQNPTDSVTLLIAAYNEEAGIFDTLNYIKKQKYNGYIKTIVIDNNSTDNTAKEVGRAIDELNMDILLLHEPTPGKFNALNHGLNFVDTKYVITLDADTLIHKDAINFLVSRMNSSPEDVVAVAGSMLVRNSRDNLLAKVQEWDYFLSIASIKRMQGLYQGTLVAQGAFSLYKTDTVKRLGGWSERI